MLGLGQLGRFCMFCRKKYGSVGRPRLKVDLIKGLTAFLPAAAVKMSRTDSILGVT